MARPAEKTPKLGRVGDLWFTRDTIVIRAEETIFQVTRSILAARSTVFQDMMAFPQPPGDDTEFIDGSPVVRLHDSAADVEVFLRAIFDSKYVSIRLKPTGAHTDVRAKLLHASSRASRPPHRPRHPPPIPQI